MIFLQKLDDHDETEKHVKKKENTPCQRDLKCLKASDKWSQFGKTLFSGPTHAHQQGVPTWHANDTGDFHQVNHRVLEKWNRKLS